MLGQRILPKHYHPIARTMSEGELRDALRNLRSAIRTAVDTVAAAAQLHRALPQGRRSTLWGKPPPRCVIWRIPTMGLQLHSRTSSIQRLTIGAERAPLLVIDNFIDRGRCTSWSKACALDAVSQLDDASLPGVRAVAPTDYQRVAGHAAGSSARGSTFEIEARSAGASRCATTRSSRRPPSKLTAVQRIPTLTRWRATGWRRSTICSTKTWAAPRSIAIEAPASNSWTPIARPLTSRRSSASSLPSPSRPRATSTADTDLFEQIGEHSGAFNRMLVYRRNSLQFRQHRARLRAECRPA